MSCCGGCASGGGCLGATGADGAIDPLSGLDHESHEAIEAALGLELGALARGVAPANAEAEALASIGCAADPACAAFYRLYRSGRYRAALTLAALEVGVYDGPLTVAEVEALGGAPTQGEIGQYAAIRATVGALLTVCPVGTGPGDCAALLGGIEGLTRAIVVAYDTDHPGVITLPIYFAPEPHAHEEEEPEQIPRETPADEIPEEPEPEPPRVRLDLARSIAALLRGRTQEPAPEPEPAPSAASPSSSSTSPEPAPSAASPSSSSRPSRPFYRGEGAGPAPPRDGDPIALDLKRDTIGRVRPARKYKGRQLYYLEHRPEHRGARLTLHQWQAIERAWQEWRRRRVAAGQSPDYLPSSERAEILDAARRYDRTGFDFHGEHVAVYAQARGRWEHFAAALWGAYRAGRDASTTTAEERRIARGASPTLDPRGGFVTVGASCDREYEETTFMGKRPGRLFGPGCVYPKTAEHDRYLRVKRTAADLPPGLATFDAFEAALWRALGGSQRWETGRNHAIIPPPPVSPSSVFAATAADLLGYEIPEEFLALVPAPPEGLAGALDDAGRWIGEAFAGAGRALGFGGDDDGDDGGIIDAVFSVVERRDDGIEDLPATEADLGDLALGWLIASTILGVVFVAGAAYAVPQVAPHLGSAIKPTMDFLTSVQTEAIRTAGKLIPSLGA